MSPLLIACVGSGLGSIGATIGFVAGRAFGKAEIDHWRLRAEQMHRRLQAMRSNGREISLFDKDRPRRWIGDPQETPSG